MKKSLFALIALIIAISFIFSGCSLINKFFKKDDNSKTPTETYSLVFNTNGGTEIATQTYKSGTILKETDLETSRKVGYNLIGWYYDSDCTEKVNFPLKITKDATIYAKWEIKKPDVGEYVTLTYSPDGVKRSIKFLKGTVLKEDFVNPSYIERVFDSWYFDYNLTNKVSFPYKIEEDITFFIKWKELYVVHYESNGGTKVKDVLNSEDIYGSEIPSRDGYKFICWCLDENLTREIYYPHTVPKEGMTLYAKWEKLDETNKYKVSFDTLGGNEIDSIELPYLNEYNLPTPTKENYRFEGWSLNPRNIFLPYPYVLTKDVTLYAHWKYDAPKDEEAKTKIKNQISNLAFDISVRICGYWGLGVETGYTYGNFKYNGESIYPSNIPERTDKDYIINEILVNGTDFDAIRSRIKAKSYEELINGNDAYVTATDSYPLTLNLKGLRNWWEYDDINDIIKLREEYTTNFLDNNLKTVEFIIIGRMLHINNGYNYYGDEILEEYYDKYLQEYYYMGLSKEDADFVFWTLSGQFPLKHHSKELNTHEIFEKIKNELILNEDAPYRIVYFDK